MSFESSLVSKDYYIQNLNFEFDEQSSSFFFEEEKKCAKKFLNLKIF